VVPVAFDRPLLAEQMMAIWLSRKLDLLFVRELSDQRCMCRNIHANFGYCWCEFANARASKLEDYSVGRLFSVMRFYTIGQDLNDHLRCEACMKNGTIAPGCVGVIVVAPFWTPRMMNFADRQGWPRPLVTFTLASR